MHIISEMYGFHVGLGDINIERQTSPKTVPRTAAPFFMYSRTDGKISQIFIELHMKNDAAAVRGIVIGTGLSFNVNIS